MPVFLSLVHNIQRKKKMKDDESSFFFIIPEKYIQVYSLYCLFYCRIGLIYYRTQTNLHIVNAYAILQIKKSLSKELKEGVFHDIKDCNR